MAGVKIGNGSIIGSGSIVNKDIPANSVAVGNLCKVIKTTEELLEKLLPMPLKLGHLKGKEKEKELKKIFKNTNK